MCCRKLPIRLLQRKTTFFAANLILFRWNWKSLGLPCKQGSYFSAQMFICRGTVIHNRGWKFHFQSVIFIEKTDVVRLAKKEIYVRAIKTTWNYFNRIFSYECITTHIVSHISQSSESDSKPAACYLNWWVLFPNGQCSDMFEEITRPIKGVWIVFQLLW